VIPIDIEHSKLRSSFCVRTISQRWERPDLNRIIASAKLSEFQPYRNRPRFRTGENTFCGGKDGGVFLGVTDAMQDRATEYVKEHEE